MNNHIFRCLAVRAVLVQPGYGRNVLKGEWQVQKFEGRYMHCWRSVSGHFSYDAATRAAQRLAKKLGVRYEEQS